MKTITINVTQEDIDNGEKTHCLTCPVARALTRAMGRLCLASSGGYGVVLTEVPVRQIDFPPRETEMVKKFIADFDAGLPVKPFSFEITI